jgi:hypothetical protein
VPVPSCARADVGCSPGVYQVTETCR